MTFGKSFYDKTSWFLVSNSTPACRDFENDITMIMLGVLPSITARKGYRARIRFTEALNEYFNNNGPETGSDMIKARWAVNVKYNMAKYAGCFEIGVGVNPEKPQF